MLRASPALARAQSPWEVQINLRSVDPQVKIAGCGPVHGQQQRGGRGHLYRQQRRVFQCRADGRPAYLEHQYRRRLCRRRGADPVVTAETLEGERLHFNYQTQQMDWNLFRAGEMPYFTA